MSCHVQRRRPKVNSIRTHISCVFMGKAFLIHMFSLILISTRSEILCFVVEKLLCCPFASEIQVLFEEQKFRIGFRCQLFPHCGVLSTLNQVWRTCKLFSFEKKNTTSNLGANTIEKGSKAKKPCADKTAEGYLQAHKDMTMTTKEQARKTQVDFREGMPVCEAVYGNDLPAGTHIMCGR